MATRCAPAERRRQGQARLRGPVHGAPCASCRQIPPALLPAQRRLWRWATCCRWRLRRTTWTRTCTRRWVLGAGRSSCGRRLLGWAAGLGPRLLQLYSRASTKHKCAPACWRRRWGTRSLQRTRAAWRCRCTAAASSAPPPTRWVAGVERCQRFRPCLCCCWTLRCCTRGQCRPKACLPACTPTFTPHPHPPSHHPLPPPLHAAPGVRGH